VIYYDSILMITLFKVKSFALIKQLQLHKTGFSFEANTSSVSVIHWDC